MERARYALGESERPSADETVGTDVEDVRETAAKEPESEEGDTVCVSTADEDGQQDAACCTAGDWTGKKRKQKWRARPK